MGKKDLLRKLIGVGLVNLILVSGCSSGRLYLGAWPLGSDLTYEQKKNLMEARNRKIENDIKNFPERSNVIPLITYEF